MKPITEHGYEGLIESFGIDVVLHVDEDDLTGYSYYLFKLRDLYGYLVFGYEACSVCGMPRNVIDDSYDCNVIDGKQTYTVYPTSALYDLRDTLWNAIYWGTAQEIYDELLFEYEILYDLHSNLYYYTTFMNQAQDILGEVIQ